MRIYVFGFPTLAALME